MDINKNNIIFLLIVVIIVLVGYITFSKPEIIEIEKNKNNIVVEEKIVYKEKECPKIVEKDELAEIVEEKVDVKENILSSASDLSHRYTISLISKEEKRFITSVNKIIFNGRINDYGVLRQFILEVNKDLIDTYGDVYFKVLDTKTKRVYISNGSCLNNTIGNYIYKTELEMISENEIMCSISEDRAVESDSKDFQTGKKVDKEIVEKLKSVGGGFQPLLNK